MLHRLEEQELTELQEDFNVDTTVVVIHPGEFDEVSATLQPSSMTVEVAVSWTVRARASTYMQYLYRQDSQLRGTDDEVLHIQTWIEAASGDIEVADAYGDLMSLRKQAHGGNGLDVPSSAYLLTYADGTVVVGDANI